MDTPTKPLQKLEKKDMVAQIANIKSANCFLQTNSPNITLANKYSCMVCISAAGTCFGGYLCTQVPAQSELEVYTKCA